MLVSDYVFGLLCSAVRGLATNTGSLQSRLQSTFEGTLARLREDDFADADQKKLFGEIMESITAIDGSYELGGVRATLNEMSDDAASGLAGKFFDLFTSTLR